LTSTDLTQAAPAAGRQLKTLLWRVAETGRFGWAEFNAMTPPRIIFGSLAPRQILQIIFFTLLGGSLSGARHAEFAFVGSLAMVVAMAAVIYVADVPVADKDSGTFFRLRTGSLHPMTVFLGRALPYPLLIFAMTVAAAAVAAPITGMSELALRLLPMTGVLLLISFTATAAGIAAAAFAVGRRAENLICNLMTYVVMLCCGAFLPPGRVPAIDAIGTVIPGRHGLAAMRAHLAGDPVGVGWLVAGTILVTVQVRRAHRSGHDDFA
jgi:ABC-2 type transport system permease protein